MDPARPPTYMLMEPVAEILTFSSRRFLIVAPLRYPNRPRKSEPTELLIVRFRIARPLPSKTPENGVP
jgi:hypothetical protein